MKYFQNFPKVFYDMAGQAPYKPVIATNITARVRFIQSIKKLGILYYQYDIQDGDTPEIMASKLYGDPNRHWIILLANNIIDPFYDWPLSYNNFNNYIIAKYGSIANAQSSINQYQLVKQQTDSITGTVVTRTFQISVDVYNATPVQTINIINMVDGSVVTQVISTQILYNYDYETIINENKRHINLIDPKYVPQIENELKSLMTSYVRSAATV
jgi:hypothetical protein